MSCVAVLWEELSCGGGAEILGAAKAGAEGNAKNGEGDGNSGDGHVFFLSPLVLIRYGAEELQGSEQTSNSRFPADRKKSNGKSRSFVALLLRMTTQLYDGNSNLTRLRAIVRRVKTTPAARSMVMDSSPRPSW